MSVLVLCDHFLEINEYHSGYTYTICLTFPLKYNWIEENFRNFKNDSVFSHLETVLFYSFISGEEGWQLLSLQLLNTQKSTLPYSSKTSPHYLLRKRFCFVRPLCPKRPLKCQLRTNFNLTTFLTNPSFNDALILGHSLGSLGAVTETHWHDFMSFRMITQSITSAYVVNTTVRPNHANISNEGVQGAELWTATTVERLALQKHIPAGHGVTVIGSWIWMSQDNMPYCGLNGEVA